MHLEKLGESKKVHSTRLGKCGKRLLAPLLSSPKLARVLEPALARKRRKGASGALEPLLFFVTGSG